MREANYFKLIKFSNAICFGSKRFHQEMIVYFTYEKIKLAISLGMKKLTQPLLIYLHYRMLKFQVNHDDRNVLRNEIS